MIPAQIAFIPPNLMYPAQIAFIPKTHQEVCSTSGENDTGVELHATYRIPNYMMAALVRESCSSSTHLPCKFTDLVH